MDDCSLAASTPMTLAPTLFNWLSPLVDIICMRICVHRKKNQHVPYSHVSKAVRGTPSRLMRTTETRLCADPKHSKEYKESKDEIQELAQHRFGRAACWSVEMQDKEFACSESSKWASSLKPLFMVPAGHPKRPALLSCISGGWDIFGTLGRYGQNQKIPF